MPHEVVYRIKRGYRVNGRFEGRAAPYEPSAQKSETFQFDVYRYAARLIRREGLGSVLDVGCGLGRKLDLLIRPVCADITGIDGEESIEHCRRSYAWGRWEADDLERPSVSFGRRFDLILCCDVVEHMARPEVLLGYIGEVADEGTWIVISTPERDAARGPEHLGPPPNPFHVREWNAAEFAEFLRGRGFEVVEHRRMFDTRRTWLGKVRSRVTGRARRAMRTQVALCRVV